MERRDARNRPVWFAAPLAAAVGVCMGCVMESKRSMAPFTALAELGVWLREKSLSSGGGNLAAWAVVLAISALPLLGLLSRKRKKADVLLPLASLVLAAWLFFLVNPTLLGTVVPMAEGWAMCGLATAGSILVCWALLRLVDRLEAADTNKLSLLLFWGAAVYLLLLGAGTSQTLLQKWDAVAAGNTGAPGLVASSKMLLCLLTGLELIPALLAAAVLMKGSRLVEKLDAAPFGEETVAYAEGISRFCGVVVRVSLATAVVCNLVQMICFSRMADVDVSVYLPVLPLALAALLQQLCRYFRRAKAVSDDNDTII